MLGAYLWKVHNLWQEIMEHTFTFFATLLKKKNYRKNRFSSVCPIIFAIIRRSLSHSMRFVSHSLCPKMCVIYCLTFVWMTHIGKHPSIRQTPSPAERKLLPRKQWPTCMRCSFLLMAVYYWEHGTSPFIFSLGPCVGPPDIASVVTWSRIGDNWCFKYRIRIALCWPVSVPGPSNVQSHIWRSQCGHIWWAWSILRCAPSSEHRLIHKKSPSIRINESSHAQFGRRLLKAQEKWEKKRGPKTRILAWKHGPADYHRWRSPFVPLFCARSLHIYFGSSLPPVDSFLLGCSIFRPKNGSHLCQFGNQHCEFHRQTCVV